MATQNTTLEPLPLEDCRLARAVEAVGDRWTLLILREAFYGVRRFDSMQHDLEIPRTVLSGRLARLVKLGLIRRQSYREKGQRARHEYRLTKKGRDLYPALVALMQWGDRYLGKRGDPAIDLFHKGCGHQVYAAMICGVGHLLEEAEEIAGSAQIAADTVKNKK